MTLLVLFIFLSSAYCLTDIEHEFIIAKSSLKNVCHVVLINFDHGDVRSISPDISKPVSVISERKEVRITLPLPDYTTCVLAFADLSRADHRKSLTPTLSILSKVKSESTFIFFGETNAQLPPMPGNLFAADFRKRLLRQYRACGPAERIPWLVDVWKPLTGNTAPRECAEDPMFENQLNVSFKELRPLIIYGSEDDQPSGMEADVLSIVAETVGFRINPHRAEHWFHYDAETQEVSGVFHDVSRGRSELGVGGIGVIGPPVSDLVFHFGWPVSSIEVVLLSPKPVPQKQFTNLVRPFSLRVWSLLIGTLFIMTMTLFTILTLQPDRHIQHWTTRAQVSFLSAFAYFCCQGMQGRRNLPKNTLLSRLLLFWMVWMMVLSLVYRSNLQAHIVKLDYTKEINTLEDALDEDLDFYMPCGTGMIEMFERFVSNTFHQVARRVRSRGTTFYYTKSGIPDDIVLKVLTEGGIFFIDKTLARKVLPEYGKKHNLFTLRIASTRIYGYIQTFLMFKGGRLNQEINNVLSRIFESGIVQSIRDKHLPPWEDQDPDAVPDNALESFTIEHVAAAFIVLSCGCFLSLVAFLFERSSTSSAKTTESSLNIKASS